MADLLHPHLSRLRSGCLGLSLASALCFASMAAHAVTSISVGAAVRSPSTSVEGSIESVGVYDGIVDLNPNGLAVQVDRGYSSTTRISVDGTSGLIKGFAATELSEVLDGGTAPMSQALGAFAFAAPLTGSGLQAIPIVVELKFHGSFETTAGQPYLNLVGVVTAGAAGDSLYSSVLSFWQAGGEPVQVERYAEDQDGNPYEDATPEVLSQSADSLMGIARVSFTARPGDLISFATSLSGSAIPGWDGGTGWMPSAGSVNFLHTGALSILLPQGYGLDSDLPLLQNVVQVVPEPGSLLLMALGLGALPLLMRRRRQ